MATEASILSSLGITDPTTQQDIINGTTRLLVLDASAHMDWDWLLPFPVLVTGANSLRAQWYFNGYSTGPAVQILSNAAQYMSTLNDYHYSICETGFLRGFADADPSDFGTLMQQALKSGNLRIAGGGITSPDNLIPHGEAFIRDYLVGHTWLAAAAAGLPAPVTAWLPDDFGHDPELPVMVQALGFIATGFERIPGMKNGPAKQLDGTPGMSAQMQNGPIDFTWSASDGSSIIAHWLIGGYGQGNTVGSNRDIVGYLNLNAPASPTPYIYVPVLSDFALPNANLSSVITNWNAAPTAPYTNVIAVAASFEDYAQLVAFHTSELTPSSPETPFNPNPYYTGCYASRPELKIRHQRATRNLLAAEVFSIIAGFAQSNQGTAAAGTGATESSLLFDGWDLLAPSTHHDFITGTAIPDVFHSEQLNLLRQADATALWLKRDAMQTIAGAIDISLYGGTYAVVFNPLGFERSGVVSLAQEQLADTNFTPSGGRYQTAWNGALLFYANNIPSLGYSTVALQTAPAPPNPVTATSGTASYTLANGLVSATITPDGLTSVIDLATSKELIPSGEIANSLVFYPDSGDEYQFQTELAPYSWTAQAVTLTPVGDVELVEEGPLRAIVRTRSRYTDSKTTIIYVREYILYANEPMLRMRSIGAAPMLTAGVYHGSTVVVQFPFNSSIDTLSRGTPYHWTSLMPEPYWNDQTFLATHNFVIPQSSGTPLGAIYHRDVPAWGISYQWNGQSFDPNNGILYGCLWRNGDGHYFNWVGETPTPLHTLGTDPQMHVRKYALRMPSSLTAPTTCGPLQEALAYASPLEALAAAPWTGRLPMSLSLASSSNPAAIVTAAKPGTVDASQFIFRVYQPTNAPLTTTLTFPSQLPVGSAAALTALEQPLTGDSASVTSTSTTVTLTMNTALATVGVGER